MELRIVSDLHLEQHPSYRPSIIEGEKQSTLVLAGDICEIQKQHVLIPFLAEMADRFAHVIYVLGNHEFYNGHLKFSVDKLLSLTNEIDNLYILDNKNVTIDGINFIGCTLWTDIDKGNPISQLHVKNGLNDYRKIRKDAYRRIEPVDTIKMHSTSKEYISGILAQKFGMKNVVVTHHAPSTLSIHEKYNGSYINSAYASDLSDIIMEYVPTVWIHGHMHDSFDYYIGETRILCNPKGYQFNKISDSLPENKNFLDTFTIKV